MALILFLILFPSSGTIVLKWKLRCEFYQRTAIIKQISTVCITVYREKFYRKYVKWITCIPINYLHFNLPFIWKKKLSLRPMTYFLTKKNLLFKDQAIFVLIAIFLSLKYSFHLLISVSFTFQAFSMSFADISNAYNIAIHLCSSWKFRYKFINILKLNEWTCSRN